MRICQVAPLCESVPPRYYGGTERVVSYLTEELVRQGHEVTLFASGDSVTSARLMPGRPHAQRTQRHHADGLAYEILMLERLIRMADEFDVVHFHLDHLHLPLFRRQTVPYLTTAHGRLDLPEVQALFGEFADAPLASVSDAQRVPLPDAAWLATVYHGLPSDAYSFRPSPGGYLAFLGRISPEKRVDLAIEVAARAGMPLKIAAKVDAFDQDYFDAEVRPLLRHPLVEFVGEITDGEKNDFLGGAAAMLFTIDWPEPFGLVMIEAMACGTPVIAFRRGSVPEVVEHGRTGFVVEGVDEAVAAASALGAIRRERCREAFDRRFTARRMACDYLRVYERLQTVEEPRMRAAYV